MVIGNLGKFWLLGGSADNVKGSQMADKLVVDELKKDLLMTSAVASDRRFAEDRKSIMTIADLLYRSKEEAEDSGFFLPTLTEQSAQCSYLHQVVSIANKAYQNGFVSVKFHDGQPIGFGMSLAEGLVALCGLSDALDHDPMSSRGQPLCTIKVNEEIALVQEAWKHFPERKLTKEEIGQALLQTHEDISSLSLAIDVNDREVQYEAVQLLFRQFLILFAPFHKPPVLDLEECIRLYFAYTQEKRGYARYEGSI